VHRSAVPAVADPGEEAGADGLSRGQATYLAEGKAFGGSFCGTGTVRERGVAEEVRGGAGGAESQGDLHAVAFQLRDVALALGTERRGFCHYGRNHNGMNCSISNIYKKEKAA
jgi:hypothetical protein